VKEEKLRASTSAQRLQKPKTGIRNICPHLPQPDARRIRSKTIFAILKKWT